MAKQTKAEKALAAAKTRAANAKKKSDQAIADAKAKVKTANAKARAVLNERPVVETVAATAAGLATGYGAEMAAKKVRDVNAEKRAKGEEVGKLSEYFEDSGNVGLVVGTLGGVAAVGVMPKSHTTRKVVQGVGIGMSAGGAALKGASLCRKASEADPAAEGPGDAALSAEVHRRAAEVRAALAQRQVQSPAALPAPSSQPMTASSFQVPAGAF